MRASRQRAPGTTAGAQREPHGSPSISAYRQSEWLAVLESTGRQKKCDGKGQGARMGFRKHPGVWQRPAFLFKLSSCLAPSGAASSPGSARSMNSMKPYQTLAAPDGSVFIGSSRCCTQSSGWHATSMCVHSRPNSCGRAFPHVVPTRSPHTRRRIGRPGLCPKCGSTVWLATLEVEKV